MTKRSYLVAALVAAALATLSLAGCDKMLESLYPDFKQGGSGGSTGQIVVKVVLDGSAYSYSYIDTNSNQRRFQAGDFPVAVGIVPFYQASDGYHPDESSIQIQTKYKGDFAYDNDLGRYAATYTFPVSRYTLTKVLAWIDVNNNSYPKTPDSPSTDPEEPGIIVTSSGSDSIDLSYYRPSDPSIYMSSAALSSSSSINWNQFAPGSGGGGGGTYTNIAPGAPTVEAPYLTVPNNSWMTLSSTNEYDPNFGDGDYITDHEWKISVGASSETKSTGYSNFLDYQFKNPGTANLTANVTLRIKDSQNSWSPWSSVKVITIAPTQTGGTNQPPVAQIQQGSSMTVYQGQYVTLNSTSYDPEGLPLKELTWTLTHDGVTVQQSMGDRFDFQVNWSSGALTASLQVRDQANNLSTVTPISLTIAASGGTNRAPTVSIGGAMAGGSYDGNAPLSLNGVFTDPDSGDFPQGWEWQLYGTGGSYVQTQYNYSQYWNLTLPYVTTNTYVTITLRANDNKGAVSNLATLNLTVNPKVTNSPPYANFSVSNSSPSVGETVYFGDNSYDNDYNDGIVTRRWTIDGYEDPNLANNVNFPYAFQTEGVHSVELTVTDSHNASSGWSETITVQASGYQAPGSTFDNPVAVAAYGGSANTSGYLAPNTSLYIRFDGLDSNTSYKYIGLNGNTTYLQINVYDAGRNFVTNYVGTDPNPFINAYHGLGQGGTFYVVLNELNGYGTNYSLYLYDQY